ncbi:Tetratricopeptide repeat protein 27 [Armadillidium vulgare]|nr:Tetratricopeptide repeat protein 27 [Armadillidium vulgare]
MEENIPFERAILYPYGEVTTDKENQCPTRPLYREIAFGNYEDALKREDCQKAFTFHERPKGKSNSIAQFYKHNFKSYIETEGKIAEKVVFCIGVACLQLFVQSNFCGPLVDPSQTFIPNLIPKESNETEVRELALEELVLPNTDGIYSLVSHPELLILARVVFLDLQSCLPSFVSTNWWCLRYAFVHQKIVDESSGILGDTIFKCLEEIENSTITDRERFSDLYSLFHLEAGNCSLYYFKVNRAEAHINKALHALGVKLTKNGDLVVRKCVIREQMEKQASLSTDVPKNVKGRVRYCYI